jgi:hypothetical protein
MMEGILRGVREHKWHIAMCVGFFLLATLIFYLRSPQAFHYTNFYAEDGTVMLNNIMQYGIVEGSLKLFNGYLVVGQYILVDIAYGVYSLFGLHFYTLPKLMTIVSYMFLAFTATLPLLLFRRQLGVFWACALGILICLTPMPISSFIIIGPIGNLKFAFMFWAVMFILFRNQHVHERKKTLIADIVLLLCVTTDVVSVALLPMTLWPYRRTILDVIRKRQLTGLVNFGILSSLILMLLSAVYIFAVLIHGIPKMPGYLDAPYDQAANLKILYASTVQAVLYPFYERLSDWVVSILFGLILLGVYVLNRRNRVLFSFCMYAIAVASVSFVAARPGVSLYMDEYYAPIPDQFFYAQQMIFMFACVWVVAPYVKSLRSRLISFLILGVFLMLASPYGNAKESAYMSAYRQRGSIYEHIQRVCVASEGPTVQLPLYPVTAFNLDVDRNIACR